MALDRPILITGTPRSGKSIVTDMLAPASEFALQDEPLMLWEIGSGSRPDDRRLADEATEPLCREIRSICEQVVSRSGRQRYLDDLAYHALRVPFIHRVLPEARIIHVIRNGEECIPEMLFGWTHKDTFSRAISRRARHINFKTLPRLALRFLRNYVRSRVLGRRESWGPRVPGLGEFAASHSPAQIAAYQWLIMVRIAREDLAKLPHERWLEIRHDQLLADPRGQSRRISEFCQVRDPCAVIDHAQRLIDPNLVFDRKIQPPESEWPAIRRIIQPMQEALGYARSPSAQLTAAACKENQ